MNAVRQELDAQLARALLLAAPPDDFVVMLTGAKTWFTGDNGTIDVPVAVPQDADVEAESLAIYLGARQFDQANQQNSASELTFRPANWVSTPNREDGSVFYVIQDASGAFVVNDSFNGPWQNSNAIPLALAMSHRAGEGSAGAMSITSGYPGGGMRLAPYQLLRRGTTVTVTISPTFSRVTNAIIKTQFRAEVVIAGRKTIRRGP